MHCADPAFYALDLQADGRRAVIYHESLRASRAMALARPTRSSPKIEALLASATNDWYVLTGSLPPFYQRGLVAAHELGRLGHLAGPWVTAYRLASQALTLATQDDQAWVTQIHEQCVDMPERVLGVLAASNLPLLLEAPSGPATSKALCDAYLDLFESAGPALARFYVPIRKLRAPSRPTVTDVDQQETTDKVNALSGGRWSGSLAPLDRRLRNAIAHRRFTVDPSGTVHIDPTEHDWRTWRPSHLADVVRDAVCVVMALLAAHELHPSRPPPILSPDTVSAAEAFGFAVAPLQQVVEDYDNDPPGMISVSLRGPRCDEAPLLEAVRLAIRLMRPQPSHVFLRFHNRAGEERGYWPLDPEDLVSTESAVDRVQRPSRDSHRYQLRLERPY
jgi:hypothetical protein